MFFYELQEGETDIFTDLIVAHEHSFSPAEFFDMVQAIRRRIRATFEEDTLVEAIAAELERLHGFIAVTDDRLTASVHVSVEDDETFLADLLADEDEDRDEDEELDDADEDVGDDDDPMDGRFRSIVVDLDPRRGPLN